jgi:Zn-dependent protease
MNGSFNLILYQISIWAIPAIIAITFHEASHGYVAHLLGDDTAWLLGRVSFNPLVHIDPLGTVVLPLMLLMLHSPFLFGYAKPVPINFRALRHPRLSTILVAAAGPGMNLLLATIAALAFHIVGYVPAPGAQWLAANLKNALLLNVILAIFNLLPIPPLDGGRILVGILPGAMARIVSRAEPYGMLILIGLIFVLPLLGAQLGFNLDPISRIITTSTNAVLGIILWLTGNI